MTTPPDMIERSSVTRGLVRSAIWSERVFPLIVPESFPPTHPSIATDPVTLLPETVALKYPRTPQSDVWRFPVTSDPICSNVADAVELPQLAWSSDWKAPFQEPVMFAPDAPVVGPVTVPEALLQPGTARARTANPAIARRARSRSFLPMRAS